MEERFLADPVRGSGRTFRTLKEVKDTYFPNVPLEQLEGETTEEQIQEDLKKFVEMARKNDLLFNKQNHIGQIPARTDFITPIPKRCASSIIKIKGIIHSQSFHYMSNLFGS